MTYQDKTGFRKHAAELEIEVRTYARLIRVIRQGNGLLATFRNELTDKETTHAVQQIIIENGTVPVDEVYTELRDQSKNQGVTDVRLMIGGTALTEDTNPDGGFLLHRIGDAVASRDVYSAIYDAFRLCSRL